LLTASTCGAEGFCSLDHEGYNTIPPRSALGYRPPAHEIIVPREEWPWTMKLRERTVNLEQPMQAGQAQFPAP